MTEIFSPVKSSPVNLKDWSNMGSLQASLGSLRLVADWPLLVSIVERVPNLVDHRSSPYYATNNPTT